jgi:hypothetical protein
MTFPFAAGWLAIQPEKVSAVKNRKIFFITLELLYEKITFILSSGSGR